ncbi:Abi family protein [Solibacillus sp. FSL R7-0668]|uniref:Abi family protein n=1 Tax=Solibacillus sp. FSL R7-0668 TaxID=2921688 RepID=UPI0030FA4EF0
MDTPIYRFQDMIDYFDRKGITYTSGTEDIVSFLSKNNYFFKLISYRKNFTKNNKDQYTNVSFELLSDLASLDMQLRYLLMKMALDLEHRIKTIILAEITNNLTEDGYSIIDTFIATSKDPTKRKKDILGYSKYSKYSSTLYEKYKAHTPIWVAFETMSFGTLIDFVEFYLKRNAESEYHYLSKNLYSIKNIRNTAAHSSSLLNEIVEDIEQFDSSELVTTYVYKRIRNKTSAKKKLNNFRIYDMTVLYIIYDQLMPKGRTKSERKKEIYKFLLRARRNNDLYLKHNQLHSIYTFFCKIILPK